MIHRRIGDITIGDIQSLIDNGVLESRTIEYKSILPDKNEKSKHEFLADVTAFANAGGGDIIYGIAEEKYDDKSKYGGKPIKAIGLDVTNPDKEKARLQDMMSNCVAPRIPGVQMKYVRGFEKGPILILRVPNSWCSPHMITSHGGQHFYVRNTAGKHKMDVTEIRLAFTLSESISDKIQRFRDDRLAKVLSDDTPVKLRGESKIVLHVIPVVSFSKDMLLVPGDLKKNKDSFRPLIENCGTTRFNVDGLITTSHLDERDNSYTEYCQVFRRGIIEAISANFVNERDGRKLIHGVYYEKKILEAVEEYLSVLGVLEISPPYVFMLSMLGMSGCVIYSDSMWYPPSIDRDTLILPELVIESLDVNIARSFRPVFDSVWNAGGVEGSRNYNEKGEWEARI